MIEPKGVLVGRPARLLRGEIAVPSDDQRASTLHSALDDARIWIQALDAKAAVLLAALCLPLAIGNDLLTGIRQTLDAGVVVAAGTLPGFFMLVACVVWLLAVYFAVVTINPMFNPAGIVDGGSKAQGVFFAASAFKRGFFRTLFLCRPTTSTTYSVFRNVIPVSEDEVIDCLLNEHLKLSSILAAKLVAFRWALWLGVASLSFGVVAALVA